MRIVAETGKSVAQVARDLGTNPYTLNNWVQANRHQSEQPQSALDEDEHAELGWLRAEKTGWTKEKAELEMERDVLKMRREALRRIRQNPLLPCYAREFYASSDCHNCR